MKTEKELEEADKAFKAWPGEKWCGFPCVSHSYEKRMSWKAYGGEGRGYLQFRANYQDGLEIDASESPESSRGGKAVMLTLTAEKAKELRDLLLIIHPLEK